MKWTFVGIFLALLADPDAVTKSVAAWALAVFMIAIILGSTYHGLRFVFRWLIAGEAPVKRNDPGARITEYETRTETKWRKK